MTVRTAGLADVDAMNACHVASIRTFGPATYDAAQVNAWAETDDGEPREYPVEDPDQRVVVAERDDDLAGFGHCHPDPAPEDPAHDAGEVLAVYVHPDHARVGVGTALLADLEAHAREAGCPALELTASLPAVPFYEHHGYREVDRVYHYTDTVEGGLECVRMRKELG